MIWAYTETSAAEPAADTALAGQPMARQGPQGHLPHGPPVGRGVGDRGLKPPHLLLSQTSGSAGEPLVKVVDFGIAKLTDIDPVRTEQGQTVGTPRYMSPEQIRVEGGADVGPQADQFSLGCIAY